LIFKSYKTVPRLPISTYKLVKLYWISSTALIITLDRLIRILNRFYKIIQIHLWTFDWSLRLIQYMIILGIFWMIMVTISWYILKLLWLKRMKLLFFRYIIINILINIKIEVLFSSTVWRIKWLVVWIKKICSCYIFITLIWFSFSDKLVI
jgi:hypothetical protein